MLDEIVASTRRRLPELLSHADQIMADAQAAPPSPSLANALIAEGMSVIAEVKRRSPSRGDLAPDLDPLAQAAAYADGGAAAISVLTEPEYFSGSGEDLVGVAAKVAVPVLRKDFIVDPIQIWQAVGWGASAVLLIVAVLDDRELMALHETAAEAGVDALVEVHTEVEARRALAAGARIVGVNNRNLGDFTVDLATAERIASLLNDVEVTVAESGIFTAADSARMRDAGYDAVLVGEALVRASDPRALVRSLRGVAGAEDDGL